MDAAFAWLFANPTRIFWTIAAAILIVGGIEVPGQ